jgi:hypothetical protein
MDILVYLLFVTIIGTLSYTSTDISLFLQNKHFKDRLATSRDGDKIMQFFEVFIRL